MPLTTQNLQLYQPEVLSDTDQGGGRMSGNLVVDGELNNLFDDLGPLDRVTGRVSLRKVFCAVNSPNRDRLLNAHAILLARALDPLVHVSLYKRDSHVDRRLDAQQHLEQYLAAGPSTALYCYETQPAGALQIVLFTAPTNPEPAGGDTLVLSVERGSINLGQQQFVRCVRVSSEIVNIGVSSAKSFATKLVTVMIDQPLRFDVPGEVFSEEIISQAKTVVRRTTLAAGKRYYSIHALSEDAEQGDTYVQIGSILTPVVPSAQQQLGITDQQIGSDSMRIIPLRPLDDAAGVISEAIRGVSILNSAASIITVRAITPNAGAVVTIRPTGQSSAHTAVLVDDGRGALTRSGSSGASVPAGCAGTVDYATGGILINNLSVATGTVDAAQSSVSYRPAAALVDVQNTDGELITPGNRVLVYNRTLVPRPQPGSTVVAYRAFGRWIELRDRGDGTLAGAANEGTGSINYATGTLSVTLGAEPDVDSHILFGWGARNHLPSAVASNEIRFQVGTVEHVLAPDHGVVPGSVSITYSDGAGTRTITDNSEGSLGGDGVGLIRYQRGELEFEPAYLPAPGASAFSASYNRQDAVTESPTPVADGNLRRYTLSNDPKTGSISVRAIYSRPGGGQYVIQLRELDDGTLFPSGAWSGTVSTTARVPVYGHLGGQLLAGGGNISAGVAGSRGGGGGSTPAGPFPPTTTITITATRGIVLAESIGSINPTTHVLSIPQVLDDAWREPTASSVGFSVAKEDMTLVSAEISYLREADSPSAQTQPIPLTQIALNFLEGSSQQMMPGTLLMRLNGRSYYDRAGVLYYRNDAGAEIQAGSLDYAAARGVLTSWVAGTLDALVVGFVATYGRWAMSKAFWRVNAPQLQTGSFQLTYERFGQAEADQGSGDAGGVVTGPQLTGTINHQTGVYALTFAEPVTPETARYNAVSVSYLPLDPEIIGLDPVRLSVDGRVPTVQTADIAVIHHTASTVLPNPVIAGSSHNTRAGVSHLDIFDAEDVRIPTDRYSFVKATGVVTFENPLNLDDYTQPLTVRHRVEDVLLVTDAQLNGRVSLNGLGLSRAYPAGESFLSTACVLQQEMQAAAFGVFAQTAWTGVWSDALIGSAPVVSYNTVAHPFEISNVGAIRERWRIEFTSVTAFRLIGETVGQVGVGDINTDFSPPNPAAGGAPYVTIRAAGWSGGANIGNQLRFNTEGAHAPAWAIRCTLAGPATAPTDRVAVEFRGGIN